MNTIDLSDASALIDAALRRADEISCPMSVAVVDASRELVAFARQPGARLASAEIAQNKAYTARSLDMSTAELAELTRPGQPLYGIETAQSRPFVAFAGGRPLRQEGVVIGAIGVSGGTVDQDDDVAAAGEAAFA
jgi:uncharacterized protein GlcG (DUF336 family)